MSGPCDDQHFLETVIHLLLKVLHNVCLEYPFQSFAELFSQSNLWVDLVQFLPRCGSPLPPLEPVDYSIPFFFSLFIFQFCTILPYICYIFYVFFM